MVHSPSAPEPVAQNSVKNVFNTGGVVLNGELASAARKSIIGTGGLKVATTENGGDIGTGTVTAEKSTKVT